MIDVSALVAGADERAIDAAARAIDAACRRARVLLRRRPRRRPGAAGPARRRWPGRSSPSTRPRRPTIAMARGGRAWRGWFPVGGELTSGVPDRKEGIYFGAELGPDHPRVRAGVPLHGAEPVPGPAARAARRGAGLPRRHDRRSATRLMRGHRPRARPRPRLVRPAPDRRPDDPVPDLPLPARSPDRDDGWGVAEHTDYGLLTILRQDDVGGLEVRTADGWIDAPPMPGLVRVQPRRHARAHDRRPLPLDAAPGPQPAAPATASRSRSSSTPPGTPRSLPVPGRRPPARAARRPLGRRRRPRLPTAPTASTCWPRSAKVFPDLL